MYSKNENKIPFKRSLGYVLLSVVIIWGSLFLTWLLHKHIQKLRAEDPRYNIVALVQTCPQRQFLQNWQLAELLDLSRDKPQNLYLFDTKSATNKLLSLPVIHKANVRRQPPGIIHVDYLLREPKALIADYSNLAVDSEGFLFALRPYFTPKNLPEIYLGTDEISYDKPLQTAELSLAFKILDSLKCRIRRIDTHNGYKKSAGLQEVVVVLEEGGKTRYLRLPSKEIEAALAAYVRLTSTFDTINPASTTQIIDLRTPNIALVK